MSLLWWMLVVACMAAWVVVLLCAGLFVLALVVDGIRQIRKEPR